LKTTCLKRTDNYLNENDMQMTSCQLKMASAIPRTLNVGAGKDRVIIIIFILNKREISLKRGSGGGGGISKPCAPS